jgi:hypothetical protein
MIQTLSGFHIQLLNDGSLIWAQSLDLEYKAKSSYRILFFLLFTPIGT